MTRVLIYLYEMLLFILPTLSLVWITYHISVLKAYSESLTKYVYYVFMALLCVSDMYIYGFFLGGESYIIMEMIWFLVCHRLYF